MNAMMRLLVLIAAFLLAGNAYAQNQPFAIVPNTGLPSLAHSWVSWGDMDHDGDPDVAVCGDEAGVPVTYVFRNENGLFLDAGFNLPGLSNGNIEWGDMDNNGWLDLLVTGSDLAGLSRSFVIPFSNGLPQSAIELQASVVYGQAHWGDFDNDGLLDILMAGNYISKILHNQGNMVFTDIQAPLAGITNASCNWVDYNNDGQLDAFLCGHVDLGDVSKLYINDHGNFTEAPLQSPGILGMSYGSSKWSDLDKDGDMDLLISGVDTVFGYILIYKNLGDNRFEKIDNYTFNVFSTNMDIADYDNDGLPDIMICGRIHSCGGSALTLLYHNDGGMIFSDAYTDIPGISMGGTAFADYNGDGFSDLMLSGTDNYGETGTRLYRNTAGSQQFTQNSPPLQPLGLTVQQNGNSVTLKWNKAADNETAAQALTYNILLGSNASAADVMDPMADPLNGFRKIACSGNAGQDTSWTVNILDPGTYYWSVQTIDNGFLPSSFSPVQSFAFVPTGISEPGNQTLMPYPNPCADKLFIDLPQGENTKIEIFDAQGKRIMNVVYADGIDVSLLPPGMYFAKIRSSEKITTIKFFKVN